MSEIPEDIMATAKAVFRSLLCPGDEACDMNVPNDIDIIARAIMAERARCAKIADELFYPDETKISARIRDAIRTPSTGEEQ